MTGAPGAGTLKSPDEVKFVAATTGSTIIWRLAEQVWGPNG